MPVNIQVNSHVYEIDGKQYYRVTTVLNIIAKPGITSWAARVGRKKVDAVIKRRCDLGTTVHSLFEHTLKGDTIDTTDLNSEIQTDIKMFNIFKKEAQLKYEDLEKHLWSKKYGYAGTCDYLGNYTTPARFLVRGYKSKFSSGGNVILDWKTSRDIYKNYRLQLAAYVFAFEEMTGIKLDGGAIIQFRDNRIRIKEFTYAELKKDFKAFKCVLTVYKWEHKRKEIAK